MLCQKTGCSLQIRGFEPKIDNATIDKLAQGILQVFQEQFKGNGPPPKEMDEATVARVGSELLMAMASLKLAELLLRRAAKERGFEDLDVVAVDGKDLADLPPCTNPKCAIHGTGTDKSLH